MESNRTLHRWLSLALVAWFGIAFLVLPVFLMVSASAWRRHKESELSGVAQWIGATLLSQAHTPEKWGELKSLVPQPWEVELFFEKDQEKDVAPVPFEAASTTLLDYRWRTGDDGQLQVVSDGEFRDGSGAKRKFRMVSPVESTSWNPWPGIATWFSLTALGGSMIGYVVWNLGKDSLAISHALQKWSERATATLTLPARALLSDTEKIPPASNNQESFPESFALAEDSLQQFSEAMRSRLLRLRQENARTTRVLNHMLEGVIAVDRSLRILAANPAARELLSMSAEPTPGRSLLELVRLPKVTQLVEQVLKQQRTLEGDLEVGGDSRRYLRIRLLLLPGEIEPIGVLMTVSDETRLRRLENLRREFIANVSHELKTPLAAIKAYAETLLLGAIEDQEKNVVFVERISQQADRLDRLIRDMLQLARVQGANLRMNLAEFQVAPAVAACVEAHRAIGEAKGVQVEVEEIPPDLIVRADVEAFQTIMNNLIGNAVRYTDQGGAVTVSGQLLPGYVCLRVQDTGIGIPQEDLQRIFERFYRVEKARTSDRGGTGLGLAIVKHLVSAQGGSVRVESELGKGSTFELRLPAGSHEEIEP